MTRERAGRFFLIGIFVPLGVAMAASVVDFFVCLVTGHSVPMPPATVGMRLGRSYALTYLTPQVAMLHDVLWGIIGAAAAAFAAVLAIGWIIAMVLKARARPQ